MSGMENLVQNTKWLGGLNWQNAQYSDVDVCLEVIWNVLPIIFLIHVNGA